MLVGRRHRIIKGLSPTCAALDRAIKKSLDMIREPDSIRAINVRDALFDVLSEIDKIIFYMAERKRVYDERDKAGR